MDKQNSQNISLRDKLVIGIIIVGLVVMGAAVLMFIHRTMLSGGTFSLTFYPVETLCQIRQSALTGLQTVVAVVSGIVGVILLVFSRSVKVAVVTVGVLLVFGYGLGAKIIENTNPYPQDARKGTALFQKECLSFKTK